MTSKDEKWAVFWCGLLRPILYGEVDPKEQNQYLKKLSREELTFPNGVRGTPSLSTLRRKLRTYRRKGFKALARKRRSDRGRSRALSREIIEKAIQLKREQPKRADETINNFLESLYGVRIPRSSLYRYLKEAGATRLKLGITKKKVRRRWTRDHTHDLWLGDFEHGPHVLMQGEVTATRLSAFIDCHSRFVVEARYYLKESFDILIDSLIRAWASHGASAQLYLDNAKVYRSYRLKAACYSLGIKVLHRPPRDPSPGGLIERFFETAQSQFEAEVRAGEILSLEKLNRALSAWLSVSYHRRVHSETNQAPAERYEKGNTVIRHVDMAEVIKFFMKKDRRTVNRDFSDVQLEGKFYRVDPKLRGDRVQVRWDPYSEMKEMLIYSLREEYLGKGILHHRQEGADGPAEQVQPKPEHNYLELLIRTHDQMLDTESRGIDYRKAIQHRTWPFTSFAKTFARMLGRRGDLSAFSTWELELLKKAYNRSRAIEKAMLEEAFEKASEKTLPAILYELRILIRRKEG